jgi:hypothetical protein
VADSQWQPVVVVLDALSANAIAERLRLEGIPVRVQSDTSLLGVARQCRVLVQAEDLRRAGAVLSESGFTDEELARLAAGEANPDG